MRQSRPTAAVLISIMMHSCRPWAWLYSTQSTAQKLFSICLPLHGYCVSAGSCRKPLKSAAVGCLTVDLTLSMNGSPARSCIEPQLPVPISENQLSWVSRHLQRGHIHQLKLSGLSARTGAGTMQRLRSGLSDELPALEHLWKGMCSQHRACIQPGGSGSLASCGEHLTCVVYTFKWRSWLHMGPLAPCMACICSTCHFLTYNYT